MVAKRELKNKGRKQSVVTKVVAVSYENAHIRERLITEFKTIQAGFYDYGRN